MQQIVWVKQLSWDSGVTNYNRTDDIIINYFVENNAVLGPYGVFNIEYAIAYYLVDWKQLRPSFNNIIFYRNKLNKKYSYL